VTRAVKGGVDCVQLRDKAASALALHTQAVLLRDLVRARGARLAINDRVDVALATAADGVHLAGQSLPVQAAVNLARGKLLVGRSVHALDEALAAASDGADYLTFGHVFPTQSHPGLPPRGLAELAEIVAAVEVPVLAIGGITPENLSQVLATGCAGICVISAILAQPDPYAAAARLRSGLDTSPHHPRRTLHAIDREPTTV
jgi:thiamine-phosphate pyrophosphorylase